jgi:uncharacterized damage-inducible protein DinB
MSCLPISASWRYDDRFATFTPSLANERISDMLEYFRKLFEFDAWANRRSVQAIASTPVLDPLALKMLAHVLAAQDLWLKRLRAQDYSGFNPFPDHPLETVRARIEDFAHDWTAFFATIKPDRIDQSLQFKDTQGGTYRTLVRDVLTQLFGHGVHHRGQINMLLRKAGSKPPAVDYIAYVRL